MQLLSWIMPVFLLVAIAVNALLPAKSRIHWIFFASILFIAWFSWQALVPLVLITLLNFRAGKKVSANSVLYRTTMILNCLFILSANYIVYFGNSLQFRLTAVNFSLQPVLLALGLSFYTLQHIAYIIDCRRNSLVPENDFLKFVAVALYFPKFLSGPLTRYQELNEQIVAPQPDKDSMIGGFNRLLLGVFKKMVIADRLAPSVHSIFDYNNDYSGFTLFIAALLFTVQLYFDFSGYTDMALGVSRMLGIKLPENFNMPLRSLSVSEFWRRWHMSLIRFFTDYIFYPLSYKLRKYKTLAASAGIACTFILSGIWHGIGLPFLLWALCHLVYLQFELFTKGIRNTKSVFMKSTGWLLTILAITFSNVFFRSTGVESVVANSKKLFDVSHFLPGDFTSETLAPLAVGGQQWNLFNFYVTLVLALGFLLFEKRINTRSVKNNFSVVYTVILLLLIFVFGIFNSGEQFIYVQF